MRPPEHPPGYKAGTYAMIYKCHNCKHKIMVAIKQGNRAPEKLDKPCPNCGCMTLWKP